MSILCDCAGARVSDSPIIAVDDSSSREEASVPLTQARGSDTAVKMEYPADSTQYQLLTVIGNGAHGHVTISLGKHKSTQTHIAIRRVHLDEFDDVHHVQHELLMCRQLDHENILKYYCTFVYNNEVWVIMPLMEYGSCKDLIHAHFTEGIPEIAIAYILRDIIQALEYLHTRGVVHRSIKSSHILVQSNGTAVLTGLGSSVNLILDGKKRKVIHSFPKTSVHNLNWLAPEVLEQNLTGYSTKSDIYSLGITACEMANGVVPFSDMAATQMLLDKVYGTIPRLLDSYTMPECHVEENGTVSGTQDSGLGESGANSSIKSSLYHRTFSISFHQFVAACLQKDPELRPSACQLLQHPFLKQVKRRSAENVPQLLYPVAPLTNLHTLPQDESELNDMMENFQSVEMDDFWIFESNEEPQ